MANLIPELRFDKNGRIVTRHVKADINSALRSAKLSAPVLSKPEDLHIAILMEPLIGDETSGTLSHIRTFLQGCTTQTLERAATAANSPATQGIMAEVVRRCNPHLLAVVAGSSSIWNSMVDEIVQEGSRYEANMFSEYLYTTHRAMAEAKGTSDKISDDQYESDVTAFSMEFIGKSLGYDNGTRNYYGYYSMLAAIESEREAVASILPSLRSITDNRSVLDKNGTPIVQHLETQEIMALVKFSKEHPDRMDDLVEFMKDRKVIDDATISDFAVAPAAALTKGIL